jgi:hypothetical protein
MNKNFKAYTLIETMIAMLITMLVTYHLFLVVNAIYKINKNNLNRIYDEIIFIKQLSYYLNRSNNIQVNHNQICYEDIDESLFCINENSNRIVKTPGFDILLHEVEAVMFYLIDSKLYISFKKGDNEVNYYIININRPKPILEEETIEYEES